MNMSKRPVKFVLSFPRTGSHFIWSRYIWSGEYQLIYDADRIPVLSVLAQKCQESLDFLRHSSPNPNYNFQYNSFVGREESWTAHQHLEHLYKKYKVTNSFDLFERAMSLQAEHHKHLFSVHRYIYTTHYSDIFKNFCWTIDDAMTSFKLLQDWFKTCGYPVSYIMVIRTFPDWVRSLLLLHGKSQVEFIRKLTQDRHAVLNMCQTQGIPIFWIHEVIPCMRQGVIDFENHLKPVSPEEIEKENDFMADLDQIISETSVSNKPRRFRFGRFIQYITERDPTLRSALIRSIGYYPLVISKYLPVIGRIVEHDKSRIVLNNAAISHFPQ